MGSSRNVLMTRLWVTSPHLLNRETEDGGTTHDLWRQGLHLQAPEQQPLAMLKLFRGQQSIIENKWREWLRFPALIREPVKFFPTIGITGTPAIAGPTYGRTSNTLYVVAFTLESGTYYQRLHALDITSGAEKFEGRL